MTQPTPPADQSLAWLDALARPAPEAGPPQASDPTMYAGVMEIPRVGPPAVGGGSFSVDMERAPEAIRGLEEALALLKKVRQNAVALGTVVPPGKDQVSSDAAKLLGAAAVGGQGSLVVALDAGASRLQALIDGLRDDLQAYDRTESSAAAFSRDART